MDSYLGEHRLCVLTEELLELFVTDEVEVLGEESPILQLLLARQESMQVSRDCSLRTGCLSLGLGDDLLDADLAHLRWSH